MVKAAEISKAEVAVVKDRAELLLKGISKEKKVAELKLAKAQPALDAAEAALLVNTIAYILQLCLLRQDRIVVLFFT